MEESETVRFTVNDEWIEVSPHQWPKNSTFRNMYEGDRSVPEIRLSNPRMHKENVNFIFDVVSKNVEEKPLDTDKIDWGNLMFTVNYLGLGVSVDYIYPLLLTIEDRIEWYKTCESRITHICSYNDKKEEEKLMEISYEDIQPRDSDYDTIGDNIFPFWGLGTTYHGKDEMIIESLSTIPNLFVAGDYVLSKFSRFTKKWQNIDIFSYGSDALKNILEGVRICLEMSSKEYPNPLRVDFRKWTTFRTQDSITIPIYIEGAGRHVVVKFSLFEASNSFEILDSFDLDCLSIGFEIDKPDKFYCSKRFIRAFETNTNVIDPTRQSTTYIRSLMKYSGNGFKIAVPGYNHDNIRVSQQIISTLITYDVKERNDRFRNMNFTGLQALTVSSVVRKNITQIGLIDEPVKPQYGKVGQNFLLINEVYPQLHTSFKFYNFLDPFIKKHAYKEVSEEEILTLGKNDVPFVI